MANYKQTTVTGESYIRSYRVIVENQKGAVPSATFLEEELVTINGTERKSHVDQATLYFNPTDTFPLINPLTGDLLGKTATHLDLQILLYSLYMDAALKRDARVAAEKIAEERRIAEAAAAAAAEAARIASEEALAAEQAEQVRLAQEELSAQEAANAKAAADARAAAEAAQAAADAAAAAIKAAEEAAGRAAAEAQAQQNP